MIVILLVMTFFVVCQLKSVLTCFEISDPR